MIIADVIDFYFKSNQVTFVSPKINYTIKHFITIDRNKLQNNTCYFVLRRNWQLFAGTKRKS